MGAWPHIARKRIMFRVALHAVLYALLAITVPWFLFVPIAIVLAVGDLVYEMRRVSRRYQDVLERLRGPRGELVGNIRDIGTGETDTDIYRAFTELVNEIERKNVELVEHTVQLLSIREIGLSLVSSLDESKVVDAVINFLSNGLGYRELFIGIFHPETNEFEVNVFRNTPGGHFYDTATVPLEKLDGAMKESILAHRPVLIDDPGATPIATLDGKPLFARSTMTSYLVVPLIKSGATHGCDQQPRCIVRQRRADPNSSTNGEGYRCPVCERIPVLGVVGVTDGFKAAALTDDDLVSVENLAVQISTMLENNRLFAELKQEEGFRENVINSMMTGLITADPQGRILFANETAAEMTGFRVSDLKGLDVGDIIVDRDREEGSPVMRALSRGTRAFQQEAWVLKSDGGRDPIVLNTSFLLDENRDVQGVLAVFRDIARLKGMEEQIVQLDKLAALGRLSSSIAHEIRNPLAGIAAGIQYLQLAGQVPESQKESISFILEEVSRIDRLIGDLMNVVRVSDLIYEDVDITALIADSIKGVSELAIVDAPDDAPKVTVDSDRIKQVLINLIKNAVEASPQESNVSITVSFPDRSDVVFDAARDFAIIEIRDEGLGLSKDDKNRVFEPFFSKKSTGTGLGLYVAHSIIERHGGYIYVDSEYGVGTAFSVYLPVEQVHHGHTSEVGHPARR